MKLFLGVNKYTSNTGVSGDMGWLSCLTKQRTEVFRFYLRLQQTSVDRLLYKVHKWSARRANSWDSKVVKLARKLQFDISDSTRLHDIIRLLQFHDQSTWFNSLWNDRGNELRGNKLRTYRKYKKDKLTESYITHTMPRGHRSVLAKLRNGSLPLKIETGRYTNPPLLIQERLCPMCDVNAVESEIHFLCECQTYSDIRLCLFNSAATYDANFIYMNSTDKFYYLMKSEPLQVFLAKTVFLMMKRRRSFLN